MRGSIASRYEPYTSVDDVVVLFTFGVYVVWWRRLFVCVCVVWWRRLFVCVCVVVVVLAHLEGCGAASILKSM